jgi:hypothetical protein
MPLALSKCTDMSERANVKPASRGRSWPPAAGQTELPRSRQVQGLYGIENE